MSDDKLHAFAEQLARLKLGESELAVALMWFHEHYEHREDSTVKELSEQLAQLALTGTINASRFRKNLKANKSTVSGGRMDAFRIRRNVRQQLDERYTPLLKAPKTRVTDDLVPDAVVVGTRPYLEKLAYQINGCYTSGFYDACAVLVRRLVEGLLVESFDKAGHAAAIKTSLGDNMMLREILGVLKSGQCIKLARGKDQVLDQVKDIGDRAAHDRYHITTKQEIDVLRTKLPPLLSELLSKAGVTKKT